MRAFALKATSNPRNDHIAANVLQTAPPPSVLRALRALDSCPILDQLSRSFIFTTFSDPLNSSKASSLVRSS